MGWFLGLGIIYILMAACNRAFGNPLVLLGLVYLGACVLFLGSIVLKVLGGSM